MKLNLLKKIFILSIITFLSVPVTTIGENFIEKKERLGLKLDSLEMEKQLKKRNGHPIDELEREVQLCKDSIVSVKEKLSGLIDSGKITPSSGSDEKAGFRSIVRFLENMTPSNPFDWIIVIVGAVAAVCVILAGFGLIFSLLFGRRKGRKGNKTPVPKPGVRKDRISNVYQHPPENRADADINREELESLRKRIDEDADKLKNTKETPPSINQSPVESESGSSINVRQEVIREAKLGRSVQEISQRCHLSIDQVNLILRMAGIKKS